MDEPEPMDAPDRADAYAATDFSEVNEAFVARLLELAGDRKNARAIDLGTGPGDVPLLVAKLRPHWNIVATDASLPMLRHGHDSARANVSNVRFVLADVKRLPIPDASFDIVFSNSLLHHLPDPTPFWREIRRIAKPGALVFVRDLTRPPSPRDAQRLVDTYAANGHPLLREDFYNSFLAAFTPAEIEEQAHTLGMEEMIVEQVTDRHMDIRSTPV